MYKPRSMNRPIRSDRSLARSVVGNLLRFCRENCEGRFRHNRLRFTRSYTVDFSSVCALRTDDPGLKSRQTQIKKHVMKAALKRGVDGGTLVQVKASYKLSADAKSAAKKKAAPKKKKAETVKKVSRALCDRAENCVGGVVFLVFCPVDFLTV
jgi:hypothetical protein